MILIRKTKSKAKAYYYNRYSGEGKTRVLCIGEGGGGGRSHILTDNLCPRRTKHGRNDFCECEQMKAFVPLLCTYRYISYSANAFSCSIMLAISTVYTEKKTEWTSRVFLILPALCVLVPGSLQ